MRMSRTPPWTTMLPSAEMPLPAVPTCEMVIVPALIVMLVSPLIAVQ